jgi:hypothetical protein
MKVEELEAAFQAALPNQQDPNGGLKIEDALEGLRATAHVPIDTFEPATHFDTLLFAATSPHPTADVLDVALERRVFHGADAEKVAALRLSWTVDRPSTAPGSGPILITGASWTDDIKRDPWSSADDDLLGRSAFSERVRANPVFAHTARAGSTKCRRTFTLLD